MSIISNENNFNPNALNTPGLYVVIQRPPGYLQGIPSGRAAILGTASWGPLNQPILLGSLADLEYTYGGISTASIGDNFDLATECRIALAQAQSNVGLAIEAIRISDGTDAKAFVSLMDTTSGSALAGLKLTAKYSGIKGNLLKAYVEAGVKSGTYNIVIVPFPGASPERYINIKGGSAGVFWANAAAAINNGQTGVRGPSELVVASNVNASAIAPALTTVYSLTGGTDGRTGVDAADFIGNASADPPTGIYAIDLCAQRPSMFSCAGLTDSTAFASIAAYCDNTAMMALLPFPAGTDLSTAITAKKTLGIDTPNIAYAKDWIKWFDSVNGVTRLVSPVGFMIGRICALSPENSPLNKQVLEVVDTERGRPYSSAQIGQLSDNGILIIQDPIPAGPAFGFVHGANCSTDEVRSYIEYSRMTNWLAHTFDSYMGEYLGELQSTAPDDPLRQAVKATLDGFCANLKSQKQIDNFKVVCDKTNNSDQSIAQHFLYAFVFVRYRSSVQYFVIKLQGGTTVSISATTIDEQTAQQIGV